MNGRTPNPALTRHLLRPLWPWLARLRLALVLGVVVSVAVAGIPPVLHGSGRHIDFAAFLASGRAVLAGGNPYAPELWSGPTAPAKLPTMNPPVWLLLFQQLAGLDPAVAFLALAWMSLLLYLVVLVLLARAYPARATIARLGWAVCLAGLWYTLLLGQIYVLVLVPTVGAVLLLRRERWLPAGLLIGLAVALKPNLLLWPILLWCGGHRRPAIWAGVGAGGVSLVPALVFGPAVYAEWATVALLPMTQGYPDNLALSALLARLGLAPGLGTALAAGLATGLAVWTWRRRPAPLPISDLALVATLVVGPLAWIGNTTVLLPAFWRRARWSPAMTVLALLLTFPAVGILTGAERADRAWLTIGSLYAVVLLAFLVLLVAETRAAAARQPPPRIADSDGGPR